MLSYKNTSPLAKNCLKVHIYMLELECWNVELVITQPASQGTHVYVELLITQPYVTWGQWGPSKISMLSLELVYCGFTS